MNLRTWPVNDDVEIREMAMADFRPHFQRLRPQLFKKNFELHTSRILTPHEMELQKKLDAKMGETYQFCLVAYHKDEIIGWSFGRQVDRESFYMVNSAVMPDFRRKGIYSALVERMVQEAASQGFQIIFGRHVATNSPVIAAKLKLGFVITGMELSDSYGQLVHLSYYTNPTRRKIIAVRSGEMVPDEEILSLMGSI